MVFFIFVVTCFISYFVGSIPSGYWFARCFFNVDITKHGSGNIGATNVARVLKNPAYFLLIFLFDASKAFVLLFGLKHLFVAFSVPLGCLLFCAVFLLIGNGYSIFLGFRGGKGIATMLGMLAYLFPFVAFCFLSIWLFCLLVTRSVGIASLGGVLFLVPAYLFGVSSIDWRTVVFLIFVTVWILFRHRSNLIKLLGCRYCSSVIPRNTDFVGSKDERQKKETKGSLKEAKRKLHE